MMKIINFIPLLMFTLGFIGVIINRSNIILILICIEILLLSMSLNFLITSFIYNSVNSQIVSIFTVTVAAVESAIGLSIMISFYKIKGNISLRSLNLLRG